MLRLPSLIRSGLTQAKARARPPRVPPSASIGRWRVAEPLPLKRVAVITKTSRLEVMGFVPKTILPEVTALRIPGTSRMQKILHSHNVHARAVETFLTALRRAGVEVTVLRDIQARDFMASGAVDGFDALFTAGGDGTFLRSAGYAPRLRIPLIGVNTDPGRSWGHLCTFHISPALDDNTAALSELSKRLEQIRCGCFMWLPRQRIMARVVGTEGQVIALPHVALNEIFVAETDTSRPSMLEMSVSSSHHAFTISELTALQERSVTAEHLRKAGMPEGLSKLVAWAGAKHMTSNVPGAWNTIDNLPGTEGSEVAWMQHPSGPGGHAPRPAGAQRPPPLAPQPPAPPQQQSHASLGDVAVQAPPGAATGPDAAPACRLLHPVDVMATVGPDLSAVLARLALRPQRVADGMPLTTTLIKQREQQQQQQQQQQAAARAGASPSLDDTVMVQVPLAMPGSHPQDGFTGSVNPSLLGRRHAGGTAPDHVPDEHSRAGQWHAAGADHFGSAEKAATAKDHYMDLHGAEATGGFAPHSSLDLDSTEVGPINVPLVLAPLPPAEGGTDASPQQGVPACAEAPASRAAAAAWASTAQAQTDEASETAQLARLDRLRRTVRGRQGPHVQRSSGVLLSTGTGSTAWMQSALAVSTAHVHRVLQAAGCHRADEQVQSITRSLNESVKFPPDEAAIHYLVREPLFQDWSVDSSMEHLKPGFTDQVCIRSLGWDVQMSFDGVVSYPLQHGWMAVFEMCPDSILWSVALPQE